MNRFFYGKLAANNIKKNAQTYIPYMLTCVLTVMMYYIIRGLCMNQSIAGIHGGNTLVIILGLGGWVVIIFSVIFLFYTNSFLIKRRKKEFGLFNILGMEKKHLSRVVLWETVYTGIVSIVLGIVTGILFSRLVYLVLMKMLQFPVKIGFEFTPKAMLESCLLFGGIFLINYLNTLRQIHLSNPIELLKGGSVGEKEPKTKWLITIIGFLCLGGGYYMAVTVESPLSALTLFFGAVILVIIGTYCLFTSGSIAILKILRKNKKYYYQPRHFTSVSGMMYRMKQNAAGLASICVLSTGVLIMISTTLSLYLGMEDTMRFRYPRNIIVQSMLTQPEDIQMIDQMIEKTLEEQGVQKQQTLNYRVLDTLLVQEDEYFYYDPQGIYSYGVGEQLPTSVEIIPLDDYNRLEGKSAELNEDEVFVFRGKGKELKNHIRLGGLEFKIKENLSEIVLPLGQEVLLTDMYYIVVSDMEILQQIGEEIKSLEMEEEGGELYGYFYGFDLDVESDVQMQVNKALKDKFADVDYNPYIESAAQSRENFFILDGGLFFLGIFLGLLFLIATVLIIYYKQVSEGYDDRERYQIMTKVGMSKKEVRQSIRSQVLNVFFLPLLMAGVHIFFAFPMISKLLRVMNLYNTNIFVLCTIGSLLVFALVYAGIYSMTAKTYYKIVC